MNLKDYIHGVRQGPIYTGPAVFRSRSKLLGEVVSMFGDPDGAVERDVRKWCVFRVQKAEIWPETLAWLAGAPDHGIRIMGPVELTEAVRAYFEEESKVLMDPSLRADRLRCEAQCNEKLSAQISN